MLRKQTHVGHPNKVNIDAGVRFGVSLDQGKRCFMEDTAACLTDAFSVCSVRTRASTSSSNSNGNSRPDLLSGKQPINQAATVQGDEAAVPRMMGDVVPSPPVLSAGASATGITAVDASTVAGAVETVAAETVAASAFADVTVAAETTMMATRGAAAYFGLFDGAFLWPYGSPGSIAT